MMLIYDRSMNSNASNTKRVKTNADLLRYK